MKRPNVIRFPALRLLDLLFIDAIKRYGNLRDVIQQILDQQMQRQHRQKWEFFQVGAIHSDIGTIRVNLCCRYSELLDEHRLQFAWRVRHRLIFNPTVV